MSPERMQELGEQVCFPRAPEIRLEVLSPGNTEAEMNETRALYLDAGAREVWLCARSGAMGFVSPGALWPSRASELCSRFPQQVELH